MEMLPVLAETPLFRGIPPALLPDLLACVGAVRRTYRRGELLMKRGDRVEQMGLVLSGRVHVVKEDFWGNRTILGLAGPGDVFAEAYACLQKEPLEVSVLAAADTTAVLLNAERMISGCQQACACHSRLRQNLMMLLAGKNLELTRKMGHMARRATREKLLSYLSAQALRAGGAEFEIPMDRQQLADYLAVDRSAMSAALGKLRRAGVLDFRKNKFTLLRDPGEDGGGV